MGKNRPPFQHGPQAPQLPVGGPPLDEFMNSIREVAVFAWSLAGINGNIASYGRGTPYGEAQPPGGLPIWDPYAQPPPSYTPPENQAVASYSRMASMDIGHMDQKTNEPGDGNLIAPFRHPRQESNLRNQNGFGAGPMGSDRPEALAQAGQGAQMAYEYQVQVQAQLDPHNPEQHDFGNDNQHRAQDQRDNPPTGQPQGPQGPSEGTQGNRYLWQ